MGKYTPTSFNNSRHVEGVNTKVSVLLTVRSYESFLRIGGTHNFFADRKGTVQTVAYNMTQLFKRFVNLSLRTPLPSSIPCLGSSCARS